MTSRSANRWLILALAIMLAVLAFALPSCGRGRLQAAHQVGGLETWEPSGLPAAPTETSIDDALTELDALTCPEGVDVALWVELKSALEEALCRAGTCAPPSALSGGSTSGGPRFGAAQRPEFTEGQVAALQKIASTPPTGEANRVNDLAIVDNGDGTYTLTWHYRNLGDYDQNGKVEIADITPLAVHFGEEVPADDAAGNSIQAVIDGSAMAPGGALRQ